MAGEQAAEIPDDLDAWLDAKAEALGVERRVIVVRALAAARLIEDDSLSDVDEVADRFDSLDRRLSALAAEFEESLEDVRERVVQVKRETNAKADEEHGHPALRERIEETIETVGEIDERVDGGDDRRGEPLDELTDAIEELDEKADTLARAIVRLQSRLAGVETVHEERAALDDLRAEAARSGTTAADCGSCAESIPLGLLSRPNCPHCGVRVVAFEPARGLFGSATLRIDAGAVEVEKRSMRDRSATDEPDSSGRERADGVEREAGTTRNADSTAAPDPVRITDD